MITTSKPRLLTALSIPAFIFIACILITFSTKFKQHPDRLSLAIILDLLLTAPVAYYLIIRKTTLSKLTVLRVFMAGVLFAGILLSKSNVQALAFIKTWIAPLAEITLIGFIARKFYVANKYLKATTQDINDFLVHCRGVLTPVFGSEKIANVFASEIAVFYYVFSKKDRAIDYRSRFTCYKENGIILVLSTFLGLFIIETAGMHFVFLLWNKTAAWILTSASFYTCLQLFAHIKALKARPVVITGNQLLLRNGLLGGDALIELSNIANIEITKKQPAQTGAIKIALIKGLENHNLTIYLNSPVTVIKAFGIKKMAKVLLVNIDKPQKFVKAIEDLMLVR